MPWSSPAPRDASPRRRYAALPPALTPVLALVSALLAGLSPVGATSPTEAHRDLSVDESRTVAASECTAVLPG
jgi:hypothetical protein